MVHYFKKAFLASFFLFFFTNSWSTVVLVQNNNDSGTGSLRDIINNASIGDTVMMNVKGTITLITPINVPRTTTILGAFPVHSVIDCVNSGEAFSLTAGPGDVVTIQGFKFTNGLGSNPVINVVNGGTARILDCLFEDNSGAANGQCIYVGSTSGLEVYNCSFINNLTSGNGAAIFVDASTSAYIRNCTFYSIITSAQGGAIYNLGTNTSVTNNTFLDNSASGGGADIYNIGSVELINNIFSNSVPSNSIQNPGAWINPSGNVFSGNGPGQYGGASINGPNSIFVNGQANIEIASVPITDGYGLKYVRIVQQTSPCVDNGTTGTFLLQTDCKRAPRILYGDNALLPDAGAVEFTPYTVTNNLAGPGDFPSKWSSMNSIATPGPHYMDFAMGGSMFRTLASQLFNAGSPAGEDWIVDGFTQQGSAIPGPGTTQMDVTPGVFFVNIDATFDMCLLGNAGANSWISGLKVDNNGGTNYAFELDDVNFNFFGNEIICSIGTVASNKPGILIGGISSSVIGGNRHHMRNVISGQGIAIYHLGSQLTAKGNFIGTTPNGLISVSNDVGILAGGSNAIIGGRYRYPSMNVISGNVSRQIQIDPGSFFDIKGNILGLDYNASTGLVASLRGIDIRPNTEGNVGGNLPGDGNVICANAEGIHIDASNSVDIQANYIGFSPEGTMPAVPNSDGIYIFSNGDATHRIGDGTFAGRNYIAGNSRFGIYLDATSGHIIDNNFIGLKPDNSALGNISEGIFIENGSTNFEISNNVISSNGSDGINYISSGDADDIHDNIIGLDSTGLVARGNGGNGISFSNSATGILVHDNIISGNSGDGILLTNPTAPVLINFNSIGLTSSIGVVIPNLGNGIAAYAGAGPTITNCEVAGNNMNGIYMADITNFTVNTCFIGTDASLSPGIGNTNNGVNVYGNASMNNMIGGTGAGDGNTIMNNGGFGVFIEPSVTNTGILKNIISGNTNLGISLLNTTPLANDLSDADGTAAAGNEGQNYPDNLVAANCGSGPSLAGDIECDQAGNYTFQIFRINPGTPDPSGHGEGNEFITELTLAFVAGNNTFSIPLPGTIIDNDILAVTSTYYNGTGYSTSEFSDTVIVHPQFTATATVTNNVLCFGGSDGVITATHGGPGPFFYNWYDNNTGMPIGQPTLSATVPAGDYYLEISTTTCTANTNVVTVSEPTSLTLTPTVTNVDCSGAANGAIDLVIAGGTGPFTHDWDNDGTGDFDDPEDLINISGGNYFVTVIDFNGCTVSDGPIAVNEPTPLSGTPTVLDETCDGLDDGSITLSAFGGTSGYLYQVDGGGFVASSTFTGLSDGVHSWDIQDANGCVFNSSSTINQGEIVTANFSANNGCQNQPVINFTDLSSAPSSISSWSWTFPIGTLPTTTSSLPNPNGYSFSTAGVNNIQLDVISGNGCTGTITLPITIFDNPIADAGIDDAICVGDPFTQNASVIGGTGPFVIDWQPDPGHFVDHTLEDPTILGSLSNTPGTYTHTMNVSDANGCTSSDVMTLTINSLPTVTAPADYNVCQFGSTTLNGTGTATIYTWDNSVIDGSPFNPSSTLTYTVTGTDGNGCQNSDMVLITVDVPYLVNAGTDFNTCETSTTVALNGASTSPNVTWSGGAGSYSPNPNTLNPVYIISPSDVSSGVVTFTLTTMANGACAAVSDDVIMTIDLQPIADAGTLPATECNSNTLTLSGNVTVTPFYTWSTNGTGTIQTPTSITTPYSPGVGETGMVTFYLTSNPNGTCPSHVDSVSINIIDAPVPNAGVDNTICSGQTYTLDGTGSVNTINYNWYEVGGPAAGNTATTIVNPTVTTSYFLIADNGICANNDTITITVVAAPDASFNYSALQYCVDAGIQTPMNIMTTGGVFSLPGFSTSINTVTGDLNPSLLPPGNYTIYYTLSTPCIAVDSAQITIHGLPDATINGTVYACVGTNPFDLDLTLSPPTSGGIWSGTGVGGNIFTPGTAGAGSHIINYSVTDGNGCTNSDTAMIVINTPPTVSISGVPSNACVTDPIFVPVGSPSGGIWFLDAVNVGNSLSVDPSTFTTGVHSISYQYTDPVTGCSSTIPAIFSIFTVPLDPTTTMPTSQSVCSGTSLSLVVSNPNTGGGTSIVWYSDINLTNQITNGPTFNTPALTNSIIYYVVIQNNGCTSNPIIFDITVNSASVSAGPDLFICPGTPAQLNVNTSTGTISWSPGATLNDSTIQDPIATPNVNTTYVVTVTNGTCIDFDSVNVIIDGSNPDCGVIPSYNAFSPDGDGVNDNWIIDAAALHPNNKVTIFNRWGDKLVEFENYDNVTVVWDGTYKGNLLPSGTYYYVIEYLDINIQVSGWLQITH